MNKDRGAQMVAQRNAQAVSDLKQRRASHTKPRRDEPNKRIQLVRADLEPLARAVTAALSLVHDQLSSIGHSGGTTSERVTGGGNAATPTADDAERASELKAWREDMRDALNDLEQAERHLRTLAMRHQPATAPAYISATLCSDAHHGRQGSDRWGRSKCTELAVSRGLCSRCYQAERTWRRDEGLPQREEDAA